jgi:predicted glycoside hydrolase/deacetylase ChbG (UPF0249 family)
MIVLNADDYALNADVDRAILALADAGRLSAASVMTNMPGWPGSAAALSTRAPGLALGLHLNLTEGRPLSAQARTAMTVGGGDFASLSRLLMKALTAQLDRGVVAAEVRAQLDAFSDALGRLPDFIDGHQHAHILNGVRDALLDTIRATSWPAPPLVRTPSGHRGSSGDALSALPKRTLVRCLAAGFRKRLSGEGLPTNDTFAGFSAFAPGESVASQLARALDVDPGGLHLVMCHPAAPGELEAPPRAPHAARRADEFDALMAMPGLPERIWHPRRNGDGAIDWPAAIPHGGSRS